MKKDTKINNWWRNFGSPTNDTKNKYPDPPDDVRDNAYESKYSKPIKLKGNLVPSRYRIRGAVTPPNALKFHHNQKLIDSKFTKQSNACTSKQKALYSNELSYKDEEAMRKILSDKEIDSMWSFRSSVDMAKNLNPARAQKFDLDISGNRRMSTDFARIISKIAEDNSGNIVDGHEMWDINKLMYRRIDNRSIVNCKSKRELESIVLLLDSSPSCSRFALLYSELAVMASKFDDVDMYNAPNARITHRYDSKKNEFLMCMNMDDVLNKAHEWKYFKNRVIVFFGDFDGIRVVLNNTDKNKVYWFCTESNRKINYELSHFSKSFKAHNLTIFENITNRQNFIKAMKKMK